MPETSKAVEDCNGKKIFKSFGLKTVNKRTHRAAAQQANFYAAFGALLKELFVASRIKAGMLDFAPVAQSQSPWHIVMTCTPAGQFADTDDKWPHMATEASQTAVCEAFSEVEAGAVPSNA